MLEPGRTIGILGGGQLGRMTALSAHRSGFRTDIYSSEADGPGGQVANRETVGDLLDLDRIREFAQRVDVVTVETENIPPETMRAVSEHAVFRPGIRLVEVSQDRWLEKTTLRSMSIPVATFERATGPEQVASFLSGACAGGDAIIKTIRSGYDGKGQARVTTETDLATAWKEFDGVDAIIERCVDFELECSMIGVRSADGQMTTFGPIRNDHRNHILDVSVAAPELWDARVPQDADEITRTVLRELDVVGVLCVEFFLDRSGTLVVNELAPRPHNSGHLTIEACANSQFDQHVRTLVGLPPGPMTQPRPSAMANLLGEDLPDDSDGWSRLSEVPEVRLHLYGKGEAREGRKMGHLTTTADDASTAEARVRQARELLRGE